MATRQRRARLAFLLPLVVLFLAACGGSPTKPAAPDYTLTILTPADTVPVGGTLDMWLQLSFTDGPRTIITPEWSTDRPDIVHVKPLSASKQEQAREDWSSKTGTYDHVLFARVTGLSPGTATVIARCSHGTVRQTVRVTAE